MRILSLILTITVLLVWPGEHLGAEKSGGGGIGAEIDPTPDNPYPDLLEKETEGEAPDLLEDDPFFTGPRTYLRDPIFEDDFSFRKPPPPIDDPLESFNRVMFTFNDKVYYWVLKPTKKVYSSILPEDIRRCLGNAFANIAAPIRFINNVLQGEFEDAGVVLGRFLINSTLGIVGLGDAAYRDFHIEPRQADFGQTLGKWGVGEGIYLCLPFLGPSNVRDTFGFFGDAYMHPVPYITENFGTDLVYLGVSRINLMTITPDVYEELKRISLDPYVAARQAYYDYRRSIITK
ncbi:MAG: VacJ family lipoprotein [Desulfofustis sp.]|nr:VacJ family lipoprotein [Desulfofustis sp.]